jgi:hypothetical protein
MKWFSWSSARRAFPAFLASLAPCARPVFLAFHAFLAFLTFLAGCGYQFQVDGQGATIGAATAQTREGKAAPKLAIHIFENKSFEPNIEIKYTDYSRNEFAAGSGAQIVQASESPDLVLKGEVLSVVLPTLVFSITEGTQETRATATVRVTVEDTRTGKVIWTQNATASSEFFVTNDLQFNRVLQIRAMEQAGRLIAADLAVRFLNFLQTRPAGAAVPPAPSMMPDPPPIAPPTADRPPAR